MFGINRIRNRRHNQSRMDRVINLLYNSSKSLSSSVKKSSAKQIHIQSIKNHRRSYFRLNMNALIQTC